MKVRIYELRGVGQSDLAGTVEYTRDGRLVFTPGTHDEGWLNGVLEAYRPKGMDYSTGEIQMRDDAELVASLPERMRGQWVYAQVADGDDGV